jgi:hypothetical protein
MTKFGRLLEIPYIICLCHTINLAALATMFEKEESQHQLNAIQESSDTEDEDDLNIGPNESNVVYEAAQDIKYTIEKMRRIVKMFQKSPFQKVYLEKLSSKGWKRNASETYQRCDNPLE